MQLIPLTCGMDFLFCQSLNKGLIIKNHAFIDAWSWQCGPSCRWAFKLPKFHGNIVFLAQMFYKKNFPNEMHCKLEPYKSIYVHFWSPVATLLWPSVGVKPDTWKKWGFGVLWDSRMFRARQQGPKHLALRCSWCHWKGLET